MSESVSGFDCVSNVFFVFCVVVVVVLCVLFLIGVFGLFSCVRKLVDEIVDCRSVCEGWECIGEIPGVFGASWEAQGTQEPWRGHERPDRGHELVRGQGSLSRLKCGAIPKSSQSAFHFM